MVPDPRRRGLDYNKVAAQNGPENALCHVLGNIIAIRKGIFPNPHIALTAFQIREITPDISSFMDMENNIIGNRIGELAPDALETVKNTPLYWVENGMIVIKYFPNTKAIDDIKEDFDAKGYNVIGRELWSPASPWLDRMFLPNIE